MRWSNVFVNTLALSALIIPIAALTLPAHTAVAADRPILKLGSQGSDVQEVQALLTLLGYYSGPIDGAYSEATLIAVSRFQEAAGLSQDGILGGQTWLRLLPKASVTSASNPTQGEQPAAQPTSKPTNKPTSKPTSKPTATPEAAEPLNPILRKGAQGNAVVRLQNKLRSRGFLKISADGDFGDLTEQAVKAAQTYYKLESDGVVGGATWAALSQ